MIVHHKYNLKEILWFLKDRKIHKIRITKINVTIMISNTLILYAGTVSHGAFTVPYCNIDESSLFTSKEELLKSL